MRSHPLRPSPKLKAVYRVTVLAALLVFFWRDVLPFGNIALLVLAVILAGFFYHYRVTARMRQQALNAALPYTSLPDKSFFLYLRSFDSAGRTKIRNTIGDWSERSLVGQYWDIEHALTAALDQQGLLVAIGDERESVGAAELLPSDEAWKARFAELCAGARGIFVLPDGSSALTWQIEQIVRTPELAAKTLFLMPPSPLFRGAYLEFLLGYFILRVRSEAQRWRRAQDVLARSGIYLPDHWRWGLIFQLNTQGRLIYCCSLDWLREDTIVALVERPSSLSSIGLRKKWF